MVETGEIVLDIGVAEGNFPLDVIDRVKNCTYWSQIKGGLRR